MYGMHVHESVIANSENKSGITIHFVNEHFDEGEIIMQQSVDVSNDDAESLAKKIHHLEYKYLPLAIEEVLQQQN